MKFVNRSKKSIEVRVGERFNFSWIGVRPGETIDLPKDKGKRYGFSDEKLPEVTEGKIGKTKVETKQFEKPKDISFYNELIQIGGIGHKIAKDIDAWGTRKKLIKSIKSKEHIPFRDDVVEKLKKWLLR